MIAEPRSLVLDNSQDPYIDKSGAQFNFSQPDISGHQHSAGDEGGFNSLMEDIKRMQEENEALKAQLAQQQDYTRTIEAKTQQKHNSLVRANEQLKKEQERVSLIEQVLGDYKEVLEAI